ncbi:hypothetical protein Desti_3647 [Desulfomonile tiedjei DSM 6799]|uniref:Uncharacterized protein n=1 Tax=Desulfomonile tiedjei (strain ATCC 49306 / DSM 6799 / DCB-1) TaxID=706587 RepID=I4C9Q2_DESTA|nr:hypothetical protein Desti_3647 [Desulfomonile tiedjei DSM 6799]
MSLLDLFRVLKTKGLAVSLPWVCIPRPAGLLLGSPFGAIEPFSMRNY